MARYEHLPIYRAAFDLAVHVEKIVRNFSRYHKYSLGTELRERSRRVLERIMAANQSRERTALLAELRLELEQLKVLARLCHESGGFASTRAYLYVAEQVVEISRQNEGWLRQASTAGKDRSGEAGHGQNRAS
jgi:hypothetical protein